MTRRSFPGGDGADLAEEGSPSGLETAEGLDPWDEGEENDLPPRPELGAWSQLVAAVLAVMALVAGVIGVMAALNWLFR